MRTLQTQWLDDHWLMQDNIASFDSTQTLILVFGDINHQQEAIDTLRRLAPQAILTGCTTAGEIQGPQVNDASLIATIIAFDKTKLQIIKGQNTCNTNHFTLGCELASALSEAPDLCHVMVFCDGLHVNASHLIDGMTSKLAAHIQITGGLAGDNQAFTQTHVLYSDQICSSEIVVVGFYSKDLHISSGSRGGWRTFGLERKVTKSHDNMLFELDHTNALDIYKSYLGDLAKGLPASGLRFPLELSQPNKRTKVVRTLLSVDDEAGSITFAGNIPEGATAHLMHSSVEALIDGAQEAAEVCLNNISPEPQVAILISCVGRKLVLKQLVDDEIEAINQVLGPKTLLCGFYSYGEIAPFDKDSQAELHNQTMTITALAET